MINFELFRVAKVNVILLFVRIVTVVSVGIGSRIS